MQRPLSDAALADIRLLVRATLATALATLVLAVATFEQPRTSATRVRGEASAHAAKMPARDDGCGEARTSGSPAQCPTQWRNRILWYRA